MCLNRTPVVDELARDHERPTAVERWSMVPIVSREGVKENGIDARDFTPGKAPEGKLKSVDDRYLPSILPLLPLHLP